MNQTWKYIASSSKGLDILKGNSAFLKVGMKHKIKKKNTAHLVQRNRVQTKKTGNVNKVRGKLCRGFEKPTEAQHYMRRYEQDDL
eukprot:12417382-Karenia_brevis.AAC.1